MSDLCQYSSLYLRLSSSVLTATNLTRDTFAFAGYTPLRVDILTLDLHGVGQVIRGDDVTVVIGLRIFPDYHQSSANHGAHSAPYLGIAVTL